MPARARKPASTNKVDETIVNQENPISSEKQRESTDTNVEEARVPEMAPAHEVDETVFNQEHPGAGELVDRNPDPVVLEDSAGIKYDVSKPYPELMSDDPEAEERKARIRQTEAALNAKDIEGPEDDKDSDNRKHIEIHFLESGLTAQGTVWKKGQILRLEDSEEAHKLSADTEGNVWYDLSANAQKDRYGKVFFEKR